MKGRRSSIDRSRLYDAFPIFLGSSTRLIYYYTRRRSDYYYLYCYNILHDVKRGGCLFIQRRISSDDLRRFGFLTERNRRFIRYSNNIIHRYAE